MPEAQVTDGPWTTWLQGASIQAAASEVDGLALQSPPSNASFFSLARLGAGGSSPLRLVPMGGSQHPRESHLMPGLVRVLVGLRASFPATASPQRASHQASEVSSTRTGMSWKYEYIRGW